MQETLTEPNDERDDRQTGSFGVAENHEVGVLAPRGNGPADEVLLAGPDLGDADGLLQLEDEPGPDRFDDGRCPSLLSVLGVDQIVVDVGVDVRDGAAARDRGDPVVEQVLASDQDARECPGPPMNLWGEMKMASL